VLTDKHLLAITDKIQKHAQLAKWWKSVPLQYCCNGLLIYTQLQQFYVAQYLSMDCDCDPLMQVPRKCTLSLMHVIINVLKLILCI